MRPFIILSSIFVLVVGLYAVTAFLQEPGKIVPITGITHFISGVVLLTTGVLLLRRTLIKFESAPVFAYFTLFFIFTGIFQLMMGLPHLTLFGPAEIFPSAMNWGYMDGHIFLYAALAILLMVPTKLFFPKLGWIPFWIIAVFGAWITLMNIFYPNAPVYDAVSGITFLNADPRVGPMIPIIVMLSWIPTAIMFAINAFRTGDALIRWRGILLAVGLFLTTFAGPAHDIARSALQYLAADVFTMLGFLITIAGVWIILPEAGETTQPERTKAFTL